MKNNKMPPINDMAFDFKILNDNSINSGKKCRITVYLDEESRKQLNYMYIEGIKNNKKITKSKLISKAISHLYYNLIS